MNSFRSKVKGFSFLSVLLIFLVSLAIYQSSSASGASALMFHAYKSDEASRTQSILNVADLPAKVVGPLGVGV